MHQQHFCDTCKEYPSSECKKVVESWRNVLTCFRLKGCNTNKLDRIRSKKVAMHDKSRVNNVGQLTVMNHSVSSKYRTRIETITGHFVLAVFICLHFSYLISCVCATPFYFDALYSMPLNFLLVFCVKTTFMLYYYFIFHLELYKNFL